MSIPEDAASLATMGPLLAGIAGTPATGLLPCPFCGSRARHVSLFERKGCFIRCDGCEVLMSRQTEREVSEAWNRRLS